MSAPWSSKGSKGTIVNADQFLILDSEDANPSTKNKLVTFGIIDANNVHTSSNVGLGEGLALAKDTFDLPFKSLIGEAGKIILTGNAEDVTFTIGADIVTLTDAQTLTNKSLTDPTIGSFVNANHNHENAVGGGQLDSTLALSDTDDIAYLNTPNTYLAGNRQSFVADASSAAINLNAFIPTTPIAGDIFRSAEILRFTGTSLTDYILVSDGQPTSYTAGVRQDFLGLLAGTAGLNVGGIAGNPTTQVDADIWLNTSSNILFARINGADVDLGVGAGITSINGDTVAVQTLTGGDGIDITDVTPDHSFAVDSTVARDTDNLSFFASTTSLELLGVINDETGSGLLVFNDTPTLLTPTITDFINAGHNHQDVVGGGQLNSTLALSDTDNLAYLNTANTYIPGNKQSVRHDATNAGLRVIPNTGTPTAQSVGDIWMNSDTDKMFARIDSTDVLLSTNITTINFIIDGGGSAITTGIKGQVVVDFDCTVIEWAIIGLPAGDIVVDVSKSTFAGFPTTVSIAGSELPTIVATNDTGEDRTLTSWTTILTGDILEFEVDSVNTIERCTVALKCRRT